MRVKVRFDKVRERWNVSSHFPTGDSAVPYKRERKWFVSEELAREYARRLKSDLRDHGAAATAAVDHARYARLVALEDSMGRRGITLEALVSKYLEVVVAQKHSQDLDEAILLFDTAKAGDGVSMDHRSHLKRYLGRLRRVTGPCKVAEISAGTLEQFVARYPNHYTRDSVRRVFINFFGFCHEKRWIPENVGLALKRQTVAKAPPSVAGVEDMRLLLNLCWMRCAEVIPYIALRTFVGIRKATVLRMDWAEIAMDEGIDLLGAKMKMKHRAYLEQVPPVIWAWLRPFARASGPVARSHFAKVVDDLAREAGIAMPKRVFRYSFASYHVAAFRNAPETAQLMAHRESPRLLWDTYVGKAKKKDGLEFFDMQPPSTAPVFSPLGQSTSRTPLYREGHVAALKSKFSARAPAGGL